MGDYMKAVRAAQQMQQKAQQEWIVYHHEVRQREMASMLGVYSPAFGQPTKPRICAYCGTKNAVEARCESCGAPNR